jgi:hypothetical protein
LAVPETGLLAGKRTLFYLHEVYRIAVYLITFSTLFMIVAAISVDATLISQRSRRQQARDPSNSEVFVGLRMTLTNMAFPLLVCNDPRSSSLQDAVRNATRTVLAAHCSSWLTEFHVFVKLLPCSVSRTNTVVQAYMRLPPGIDPEPKRAWLEEKSHRL